MLLIATGVSDLQHGRDERSSPVIPSVVFLNSSRASTSCDHQQFSHIGPGCFSGWSTSAWRSWVVASRGSPVWTCIPWSPVGSGLCGCQQWPSLPGVVWPLPVVCRPWPSRRHPSCWSTTALWWWTRTLWNWSCSQRDKPWTFWSSLTLLSGFEFLGCDVIFVLLENISAD